MNVPVLHPAYRYRGDSPKWAKSLTDFTTIWKTDNPGVSDSNQVRLPLELVGAYDFTVYWGDGEDESFTNINSFSSEMATHTYEVSGTYTITIAGGFLNGFKFNNSGDKLKILEVTKWGNVLTNFGRDAFYGCSNLDVNATDSLTLSNGLNTFRGCASLVGNSSFNDWDVSSAINLESMFRGCVLFNQPLNNWDVSNVNNMAFMFNGASIFNGSINDWNVSSLTTSINMFQSCVVFNQPLNSWNTSSLFNMTSMFLGCLKFNQPLNNWDVSNVRNMSNGFLNCKEFNQPLNSWNISNVTNIGGLFQGCTVFNQPLNSWNTSNVNAMFFTFSGCINFDQDLSSWNVEKVTNMVKMFDLATLSTLNYDALLNAWAVQSLKSNVVFSGGNSKHSSSSNVARFILTNNYNWTITDGGSV